MKQLTDAEKQQIIDVYNDCETEEEREDAVEVLAVFYNQSNMSIRQLLQVEKVYVAKEGKTEKEQYAAALWAITNIKKSEWMKLTLKTQKELMAVFKGGK